MNSAVVAAVVLTVFALGYRFYSRWLATHVFDLDDATATPAHVLEDGIDYVPTGKHVLFGHHFSSIAGAAPIVGPAVAVIWGWVPAILWIGLGVVFAGAVHDMSALVISMRHKGRSIGDVTAHIIGPRSRVLFLLIIFFLTMMVLAVFATVIAYLFVQFDGAVLPVTLEIPVACIVGWMVYKKGAKLLVPSLVVLVGLYLMIWLGAETAGSMDSLQATLLGEDPKRQKLIWSFALLGYAYVASVLPVWLLLQPRDFINSHQLIVGLAALFLGIAIVHPPIVAPAFHAPADSPPWFPMLFVTIACGAVSGFHGLVSSGTTAKQIERESEARQIGYGGMVGEGCLALVATLAVTAGFSSSAEWHTHYASWGAANGLGAKIGAFVSGSSVFLEGVGIPSAIGSVVVAVLVISFAATSLDTATRIQRFVVQELADVYQITPLKNRYAAGLVAVSTAGLLVIVGNGGLVLWPLFGAGNQLLAGLTLLVVSLWLAQKGKNFWVTLAPALFLGAMTSIAMFHNLKAFHSQENWLLLTLSGILVALELWIVLEGVAAFRAGSTKSAAS